MIGENVKYKGKNYVVGSFHFDSWDAIYWLIDEISKGHFKQSIHLGYEGVLTLLDPTTNSVLMVSRNGLDEL